MCIRVSFMVAAIALCGCPGSLADIEKFRVDGGGLAPPLDGGPIDCPTFAPQTLGGTCAAQGCHSGALPGGNLDLTQTGDLRERLRNKPTLGAPSLLLIDMRDFTKSALYTKTGNPPPYGFVMPPTGVALDERQRACILDWIKATPPEVTDAGRIDSGPIVDSGIADAAAAD